MTEIVAQAIKITFTPDQSANRITEKKLEQLDNEIMDLQRKIDKQEVALTSYRRKIKEEREQRPSDLDYKLSIERTTIKNAAEDVSFYFRVINHAKTLYQSRKTIIGQPCWRDDVFTLQIGNLYTIEIRKVIA